MIKLLLILLLFFSLITNVFFIKWFLTNKDFLDKRYTDQPFSFFDPSASYFIKKNDIGTYSITFQKGNEIKTILIGSSQIPLDKYLDKKVTLVAEFRPILGIPTCHKPCDGNGYAPVVDIREIKLIEK